MGIHAVQHARPVLGLGAAGPGVEGHDRVVFIVFALEQRGQLLLFHLSQELVVIGLHLGIKALVPFLQGHVDQLQRIIVKGLQGAVAGGLVLQLLDALQHLLRVFRLVPKSGGRRLFLQLLRFPGAVFQVQRAPQLHQLGLYIGQIRPQFF